MKYRNTGNVFGHKIECKNCGIEAIRHPCGWTAGKEQQAMDEAKADLVAWWNARSQPNYKP